MPALPFQYSSTVEPTTAPANPNPPSPAEFLPATALGDGRPLDAGGDVALARTANAYNDYMSGQHPLTLGGYNVSYGVLANARSMISLQPVYLGADALSNSVYRYLFVEPWIQSRDGSVATIWVTLTRSLPTWSHSPSNVLPEIQFNDLFQTFSATTTSTTPISAGVFGFSCVLKDSAGQAFLVVEGSNSLTLTNRGFIRMFEGPRITQ